MVLSHDEIEVEAPIPHVDIETYAILGEFGEVYKCVEYGIIIRLSI